MSLTGLLVVVVADPAVRAAVDSAGVSALDLAAPGALRPFVVAALAADVGQGGAGRPVLAVTATGREAEDLVSALCCLLPPTSVAFYPSWETLPHERLSPRADTVGRRLAVRRRLAHPRPDDPATGPLQVVVAAVRSLLEQHQLLADHPRRGEVPGGVPDEESVLEGAHCRSVKVVNERRSSRRARYSGSSRRPRRPRVSC